jgi:hypothetical protein
MNTIIEHARACHTENVRTTVEMKPEHRSALLAIAARRGEKGFSGVLEEAIETYLKGEDERKKRREKFLSLAGTLTEEEGEELRREVERLRASWR